jgi:hypothetical protein
LVQEGNSGKKSVKEKSISQPRSNCARPKPAIPQTAMAYALVLLSKYAATSPTVSSIAQHDSDTQAITAYPEERN